jgi:hypothetical protein
MKTIDKNSTISYYLKNADKSISLATEERYFDQARPFGIASASIVPNFGPQMKARNMMKEVMGKEGAKFARRAPHRVVAMERRPAEYLEKDTSKSMMAVAAEMTIGKENTPLTSPDGSRVVPLKLVFPLEYFIDRKEIIERGRQLLKDKGGFYGILLETDDGCEKRTRCKVIGYENGKFLVEMADKSTEWEDENDVIMPEEANMSKSCCVMQTAQSLAADFERTIIQRQISRMLEPVLLKYIPKFDTFWRRRFLCGQIPNQALVKEVEKLYIESNAETIVLGSSKFQQLLEHLPVFEYGVMDYEERKDDVAGLVRKRRELVAQSVEAFRNPLFITQMQELRKSLENAIIGAHPLDLEEKTCLSLSEFLNKNKAATDEFRDSLCLVCAKQVKDTLDIINNTRENRAFLTSFAKEIIAPGISKRISGVVRLLRGGNILVSINPSLVDDSRIGLDMDMKETIASVKKSLLCWVASGFIRLPDGVIQCIPECHRIYTDDFQEIVDESWEHFRVLLDDYNNDIMPIVKEISALACPS